MTSGADVQLENGYTRIANRLLEAMLDADLTGTQIRILVALVRLTYGWRKKTVTISHAELAERANMALAGGFRRALQELVAEGVVLRLEVGGGPSVSTYAVQKDFSRWGRFSIAPARLESLWSDRPTSADELLPPSPRPSEDIPPQGHDPIGSGSVPLEGQQPCPSGDTATGDKSKSGAELPEPKDSESKGKTEREPRASAIVPIEDLLRVGNSHDDATAINLARLRERLNGEWPDVERFLRSRKPLAWPSWLREMSVAIGPATGSLPIDLAGACVDALALEKPIDGPHALRAFVDKRRRERRAKERETEEGPPFGGASGSAGQRAGGRGVWFPTPESDRVVDQILARARSHQSNVGPRWYIPRDEIEALGAVVAKAYERAGGVDRFLAARVDGEKLQWLRKDFAKVYAECQQPSEAMP